MEANYTPKLRPNAARFSLTLQISHFVSNPIVVARRAPKILETAANISMLFYRGIP